ncbi:transcriptional regulator [Ewingella sp. S1.OA.A_B6]
MSISIERSTSGLAERMTTNHHTTQALTEEANMNSRQRNKLARAIAHRAEANKDMQFEKRIALSLSGCSARVYKATMTLPLRSKEQASADNICLPDVAIFAAGHRKPTETITAR